MSNEIKLANATIKVWRIKKSMNCYAENSQAEMTVLAYCNTDLDPQS